MAPTADKQGTEQLPAKRSTRQTAVRSAITIMLQLLAAVLFVVAVFWIFSERGGLPIFSARGNSSIPQSIAAYQLQSKVVGQAAIDELTGMHGKDVELSGGWIGRYQAGGIIWYGSISSEAKASELIARMSAKIAAGNPTFTNLQQFNYEGVTVYAVVGTGQQHFFYQMGKNAIWLAAPRGGEEAFLKDALRVLK